MVGRKVLVSNRNKNKFTHPSMCLHPFYFYFYFYLIRGLGIIYLTVRIYAGLLGKLKRPQRLPT